MKKAFVFLVFMILIFLPAVLYIKLICDFEDFEFRTAVERFEQNKKIYDYETTFLRVMSGTKKASK